MDAVLQSEAEEEDKKRQEAEDEVERRRSDPRTYTVALDLAGDNAPKIKEFLTYYYKNILFKKDAEMKELRNTLYPETVGKFYQRFVIEDKKMSNEDFWQRYYYRVKTVDQILEEWGYPRPTTTTTTTTTSRSSTVSLRGSGTAVSAQEEQEEDNDRALPLTTQQDNTKGAPRRKTSHATESTMELLSLAHTHTQQHKKQIEESEENEQQMSNSNMDSSTQEVNEETRQDWLKQQRLGSMDDDSDDGDDDDDHGELLAGNSARKSSTLLDEAEVGGADPLATSIGKGRANDSTMQLLKKAQARASEKPKSRAALLGDDDFADDYDDDDDEDDDDEEEASNQDSEILKWGAIEEGEEEGEDDDGKNNAENNEEKVQQEEEEEKQEEEKLVKEETLQQENESPVQEEEAEEEKQNADSETAKDDVDKTTQQTADAPAKNDREEEEEKTESTTTVGEQQDEQENIPQQQQQHEKGETEDHQKEEEKKPALDESAAETDKAEDTPSVADEPAPPKMEEEVPIRCEMSRKSNPFEEAMEWTGAFMSALMLDITDPQPAPPEPDVVPCVRESFKNYGGPHALAMSVDAGNLATCLQGFTSADKHNNNKDGQPTSTLFHLELPTGMSDAISARIHQVAAILRTSTIVKAVSVVVPLYTIEEEFSLYPYFVPMFEAIGALQSLEELKIDASSSDKEQRSRLATTLVTTTFKGILLQHEQNSERGLLCLTIKNMVLVDTQEDMSDFKDVVTAIRRIPTLSVTRIEMDVVIGHRDGGA